MSSSRSLEEIQNVFDIEKVSCENLGPEASSFLNGGADDLKTVNANCTEFDKIYLRPRRLVDVREINSSIHLFDQRLRTPIILAPVGLQGAFHSEAELPVARAAGKKKYQMVVSTITTKDIFEISESYGGKLWLQLYPTSNRKVTTGMLNLAEQAGCEVMMLTVDVPVVGNREGHVGFIKNLVVDEKNKPGNLRLIGEAVDGLPDPSLDWSFLGWLRKHTKMKILIKGIVTAEDAELCIQHGVDGVVVSNHGGRQLDSNYSTIRALPEVAEVIDSRMPILFDGGIRRGTDIIKALALGANAVCIGRTYLWGLAAYGQPGVEKVLDILETELVRDMKLMGATSIDQITRSSVGTI